MCQFSVALVVDNLERQRGGEILLVEFWVAHQLLVLCKKRSVLRLEYILTHAVMRS